PAKKLFTQGMVCATSFRCPQHKWLKVDEVEEGKCIHCKSEVETETAKMSKTRLNVVDPEDIVSRFGADALRAYILADVPPVNDRVWKEEGVIGISRFLSRFWESVSSVIENLNSQKFGDGSADKEMRFAAHNALKNIIQYYDENWQFNTALARVMELLNSFRKLNEKCSKEVTLETIEIMLKVLAPITPHLAEELWEILGNKESIFKEKFPKTDENALIQDSITIGVQINGKMRGTIDIPNGASNEETEKIAMENSNVRKHLEGLTIRKVIVVSGKIVNIVAG
ncbi:MAG: class I tRNA ligase family protein, partial [Chitinivibrionia bacterium]|nr:class I tRNA ligase family protein [Chitinivibrionia bacterium]